MKTPILFIVSDPNYGDSLMAMAAMQIVAKQHPGEKMYAFAVNQETFELLKPPNVEALDYRFKLHRCLMDTITFNIGHSFIESNDRFKTPRYAHPITQYLRQAEIHEADGAIYDIDCDPRLYNAVTHQYALPSLPGPDFLIHAFSGDESRVWPFENYHALFEALEERTPGCDILVIGSERDPKPWRFQPKNGIAIQQHMDELRARHLLTGGEDLPRIEADYGIRYMYNLPMRQIVQLMRETKQAVITIDSGPGRLAHVAGIPNHVLLHPNVFPEIWNLHKGVQLVSGDPKTWTVDAIMEKVAVAAKSGYGKVPNSWYLTR